MPKGRLYLCTCQAIGCGKQTSYSEHDALPVIGTWVSKPLYFRHKRLDKFCYSDPCDPVVESFEDIQSLGPTPERALTSQGQSPIITQPSCTGIESQIPLDPNVRLAPLADQTVALEAAVTEHNHLLVIINQRILSFSVCGPLAFSDPPTSQSLKYETGQAIDHMDRRLLHLDPSSPENGAIAAHESHMLQASHILHQMDVPTPLVQQHDLLFTHVSEELRRIEEIKILEWNRQVQLLKDGSIRRSAGVVDVDSGNVI